MIFVIAGPTGSGKTSLALDVAKQIDAEIINGDAFQVYEEFNVGTAKPSIQERTIVKHHLFDFVNPSQNYNVKDYQEAARSIIEKLRQNKKNIIIVGGTGLYQKATLFDFSFKEETTSVDMSDLICKTNEELYSYLKEIDEESIRTIHQNNRKRILRAIEIYRTHGVKKSDIIKQQEHKLIYDDVVFVGLEINRDVLYQQIDNRVEKMFDNGLLKEVEVLKNKYDTSIHAFQAIGYKELLDYFDNKITLDEAKELIKKHSRNYAKRQMTYFRHQLPMTWFDNLKDAHKYIIKSLSKKEV